MKYILSIALVTNVVLFNSCDPCSLDRASLINSALTVDAFNTATQEYFYPEDEWRSPFKKDSLQVLDENGKKIPFIGFGLNQDPRNPLKRFYAIGIKPAFRIPEDNDAFDKEKSRQIFLKYNYNTSDTLTLVFKGRRLKCDASVYEYLKVYHRNQLIASVSGGTNAVFTLNH
jgi:hypothetical protein